ncbi:hypothetical protein K490DRAFT_67214 [Saccharata proteae CBS 121410]|uniref:Uncharacterized protein n=1 Tax=Saccharata proteae CBS 121410 TaxID=1314787 RepID=A0A9P4HS95_9PEZI|nr:hypothetical protein K490DRAFT_67214 [Saccharata proteae CBS 121410]
MNPYYNPPPSLGYQAMAPAPGEALRPGNQPAPPSTTLHPRQGHAGPDFLSRQMQWTSGRLFLRHPAGYWLPQNPQLLPPSHFFNHSTVFNLYSSTYISNFNGQVYLYIMPAEYGNMAFKVAPQPPQASRPDSSSPAPDMMDVQKRKHRLDDTPQPPTKKPKVQSAPKKMTRLRKDRPVQSDIYEDVWCRIMEFSDPAMLFTMKKIGPQFSQSLRKYQHIWRNSAENYYGSDLPPTPAGLEHYQFADLLAGQGCMSCGDSRARKPYWAFLRRWCEKCFCSKTMKHEDTVSIDQKYPGLLQCTISATVDSWGHYSYAGWGQEDRRSLRDGCRPVYLKKDVTDLIETYEAFLQELNSKDLSSEEKFDEQTEWMKVRRTETQDITSTRFQIDMFEKKWLGKKAVDNAKMRKDRGDFIIAKCLELNPPLHEDALKLIPAYKSNLKIVKEGGTDKMWNTLRPKLLAARGDAEKFLRLDYEASKFKYYDKIDRRREQGYNKDGEKIYFELADNSIRKVEQQRRFESFGAQEFTLRVLSSVWESYNTLPFWKKPPSQIPLGSPFNEFYPQDGRYVLMIEDACKIYDQKIVHKLNDLYPEFRNMARERQKFKCPGCTRNDVKQQHNFYKLFPHILLSHANVVGDFLPFRLAGPNHYFSAVPWPRNLPVLTSQQKATGKWDSNKAPSGSTSVASSMGVSGPEPEPVDRDPSAFEGRQAGRLQPSTAKSSGDFVGHFRDAITALKATSLSIPVKSKLALAYANQHWTWFAGPSSANNNDLMSELDLEMVRLGEYEILSNICCETCRHTPESRSRGGKNYGKFTSTRPELIKHFRTTHQMRVNYWTTELFALPSDQAVYREVMKPENVEVFEAMFPKVRVPAGMGSCVINGV